LRSDFACARDATLAEADDAATLLLSGGYRF
jgi:hypothetical protein